MHLFNEGLPPSPGGRMKGEDSAGNPAPELLRLAPVSFRRTPPAAATGWAAARGSWTHFCSQPVVKAARMEGPGGASTSGAGRWGVCWAGKPGARGSFKG